LDDKILTQGMGNALKVLSEIPVAPFAAADVFVEVDFHRFVFGSGI
jgi:hypothetical protein